MREREGNDIGQRTRAGIDIGASEYVGCTLPGEPLRHHKGMCATLVAIRDLDGDTGLKGRTLIKESEM